MRKVVFAVGGTGGHLFPAQALADEMRQNHPGMEILFAGGKLGSNTYFDKLQFPFREISSGTPFRSNPVKAGLQLLRGVFQGLSLFKEFPPDLLIGFGSFYSFPLLVAARLWNIPYILVESNAHPGKVNRLFASKAIFSALQFAEAASLLKGKTQHVKMPFWAKTMGDTSVDRKQARKYFKLDPETFTILIFGGSQGAVAINEAAGLLEGDFQAIHLCGQQSQVEPLTKLYELKGIACSVKPFENQMRLAYTAADLVISRAGAGTLSELIEHTVPSILVPWPGATERHQHKNAAILEKWGGAILLDQERLDQLPNEIQRAKERLQVMRENLSKCDLKNRETLCELIVSELEGK